MKDTTKNILKVAAVVVAFALIISSVFIIRSCSAPPDYEEVRARVEELIEASFDVNDVVWGEGLPTYERITDPKSSITLYKSGDTYLDENGAEQPLNYYYYYTLSKDYTVIAFREQKGTNQKYRYAYVTNQVLDAAALTALFPPLPLKEGETAPTDLYTEVFSNTEKGIYAYIVPFSEPHYDFYYMVSDPSDYDYVVADSKYASIDAIKAYVRTVYAPDYADSLDSILFDGVMEGELIQKARYANYDSLRGTMLTKLNTYEPLYTERRVYLYETAVIDRANSNETNIIVDFSTYLPSAPEKIQPASVSFSLVDGVWYLSSPTY